MAIYRDLWHTEEIRLEVAAEVARKYREATPEQQNRVRDAVERAIMSREERMRRLEGVMDRMAETARKRGLTQSELQDLLDEHADDG